MNKVIAAIFIITLLSACSDSDTEKKERVIADQCIRAELFKVCVKTAQVSLSNVSLNDNGDGIGDSVRACETAAYYQSRRLESVVKHECKGE